MSKAREYLIPVLVVVVSPLVFWALLEGGLRLFRYGFPASFLVPAKESGAYQTNPKFGWRFFPPELARTPVPALIPRVKGHDTYRIFILGESAAMGFPEPAFSFGAILGVLLRDRFPGVKFEVINASMTAINSHAVLQIARDCARLDPDAFLIYVGNNEVVGPYGPGTVFRSYSPSLPLIRAALALEATRAGQLFQTAASRLRGPGPLRVWNGLAMFLNHRISAEDPRMQNVYSFFRQNLADICSAGRKVGAAVVLSTVAVNLRDCPPFASDHKKILTDAERSGWEAAYRSGSTLMASGNYAEGLAKLLQAAGIDNQFAELHYQLGTAYRELRQQEAALRHYTLARDLDTLRFRVDSRLNEIIREQAARLKPEGVVLVDGESAFQKTGIPGEELFYEHVHTTFEGNYLLARIFYDQLVKMLPEWIRRRASGSSDAASQQRVGELMAITGWDRYRVAADIFAAMERPPFTTQLDYARRRAGRLASLKELETLYASASGLAHARTAYQNALAQDPTNLLLHQRLAELFAKTGELARAEAEWRTLLDRVPDTVSWRAGLAGALSSQGKLDEALVEYRRALADNPHLSSLYFQMGSVLAKKGDTPAAVAAYEESLRIDPSLAKAHYDLGVLQARQKNFEAAMQHYREALRLNPADAESHNNLGSALARTDRLQAAIPHFQEALRLRPGYAEAHYNLGVALAVQGRSTEAADQFAQALRNNPGFAPAREALAKLTAGSPAP